MSRGEVAVYHDDSVDNDEKRLHSNFHKALKVCKCDLSWHPFSSASTEIVNRKNKSEKIFKLGIF